MNQSKRNQSSINYRLDLIKKFKTSKHTNSAAFARIHGVNPKTFQGWLRLHSNSAAISEEQPSDRKRERSSNFPAVEEKLIAYINLRTHQLKHDGCGLNRSILKLKAMEFAEEILTAEDLQKFSASDGWLTRCLTRHNVSGFNLHGEAGGIDQEKADREMLVFKEKIQKFISDRDIPPSRIFNADQTGLFYQKLPNRIYCKKKKREGRTSWCKADEGQNTADGNARYFGGRRKG